MQLSEMLMAAPLIGSANLGIIEIRRDGVLHCRRTVRAHVSLVLSGVLDLVAGDQVLTLATGDVVVVQRAFTYDLRSPDLPANAHHLMAFSPDPSLQADTLRTLTVGRSDQIQGRTLTGAIGLRGPIPRPLLVPVPDILHFRGAAFQLPLPVGEGGASPSIETLVRRPGGRAMAAALLSLLYTHVMRSTYEGLGQRFELSNQRNGMGIEIALQGLHQRLDEPWTPSSLASLAAMSRSAFAAHFVVVLGETPMRYLARARLERAAAHLARDNNLSIGEVARAVGYQSHTVFARAFKNQYGLSPIRYRQAAAKAPGSSARS